MTVFVPFYENMKVAFAGSLGKFGFTDSKGDYIISEAVKIHLAHKIKKTHISGFYLCYINSDGLYREGGISSIIDNIALDLLSNDRKQLKIIGVDLL